jgi:hypothetical protein
MQPYYVVTMVIKGQMCQFCIETLLENNLLVLISAKFHSYDITVYLATFSTNSMQTTGLIVLLVITAVINRHNCQFSSIMIPKIVKGKLAHSHHFRPIMRDIADVSAL